MYQYSIEFLFGSKTEKKLMEEKKLTEKPFVSATNLIAAKLKAFNIFGILA